MANPLLLAFVDTMHTVTGSADILADGEKWNPSGTLPPEVQAKINKLLGWASGVVGALCVAGVLFVAGRMAIKHGRGEGGEHAAGLGWVGAACLLVGTAAFIVQGLIG